MRFGDILDHMLNTIILGLFVLTSVECVLGQTSYGFRIGANTSTLTGDSFRFGTPSYATGLVAGSFTRFALRGGFGIQAEALYSTKGARFETEEAVGGGFDIQIVYLEIPLMLTYTPPFASRLRPMFSVGPAVGFELSERIQQSSGQVTQSETNDELASPDVGIALGGDVEFDFGGLDGLLGVRYNLGLRNLANTETNDMARTMSRTVSITLGFLF